MRKKIFGFVLVVAMVVALFAGMTVTASAANYIEEVEIQFTGSLPAIETGADTYDTHLALKNIVSVPDLANYELTGDVDVLLVDRETLDNSDGYLTDYLWRPSYDNLLPETTYYLLVNLRTDAMYNGGFQISSTNLPAVRIVGADLEGESRAVYTAETMYYLQVCIELGTTEPTADDPVDPVDPAAEELKDITLTFVGADTYTVNGLTEPEDGYSWYYELVSEGDIAKYFNEDDGITAVPSGTWSIDNSWMEELEGNQVIDDPDDEYDILLVCKVNTATECVVAWAIVPLADADVAPAAEELKDITLSTAGDDIYTVNGLKPEDGYSWYYELVSDDEIAEYFNEDDGITAVPSGTWSIDNSWMGELEDNQVYDEWPNPAYNKLLVCKVNTTTECVVAWAILPLADATVAPVAVTGVTLDKTTLSLKVGDAPVQLYATVAPDDAADKTVTWSSDNTDVATVDTDGKVTAVATGTAHITATAADGSGKSATCTVTVTASQSGEGSETTGTIWNWSELKNGDILKPGDIVNNDIGNDVEEATINVRDRHYDRNVYISVNGSVTLEGSYTAEDGAAPNYKIESEEWVVMIDYLYPDPETRDYGERRVNLVKKTDANWVEVIEVDVEQTEGEDSYTITLVDKEPGYLYIVMGVQDLFDAGLIGYNEIRGQAEFMCEMIAMTIQETEKAAENELDMINQMALTTDSFEAPSCSLVFIMKLKQADGVEGKEYNYLTVGATYLVTDRLTHDVTVADTENGTVAASVRAAKELDTVTLTVTPADGYALESLAVEDAEGNKVTVEDNTFTMPRSAVTVTAVFDPAESGEGDEPETPPADGDSVIGNNGYPYGKDMNYSSVTLVVDTKVSGATYQWQSSTSEDGTYTDIEGAVNAAYTETYPDSGTWYRCVVNGEVSKAVQIVSPGYDGRNWTASSGSYYVSNGTMAYRVNGYMFDATGLYYKNGTAYMLQTSYSYQWAMYSSEYAEPEGSSYSYATYADLDALKASFDESNAYRVVFEADLAEGQQAFSFGCDTQLGNSSTSGSYADSAALIGTVKNDSLLQVAMIGAASQEAALGTDPAFVIAPDSSTPASRFWIGHYSSRQTYAYNTYEGYGCSVEKINGVDVVTRVEGDDSGMTVSWMNIPSGGSVKFEFKVGSVADTGAVPSASVELTSKTVTIKDTENVFFYQILDENGMPLEGITYMDANGNELTPDEDGWVQGVGGDIIISGLQQSTSYQIVTAAKDENGVLDEENAAVEDVITPINPGVTVDPETGEETEIVCVATGNSLTFTGLNEDHYYFLQTEDGYEIYGEYIDGELVFSELPAGYDFYLAAVSEDNQTYEPVLYSTNSVTVTFDANGGVDAPEAQTLAGENQYLTWEVPYREGYVFQGWAGSADAERAEYWPDDWPNLSEDTTLYAVWEEIGKVDLEGEVVFNYSYSYTLPNGSVQRGTQNEGERATKVRVTLLKNGTPVGEPVVVDVEMFDDYAVGTYCFEDMPLTNEYGSYINYTVQAVALRDDESENRDYGVYCSGYSYVSVSYSPECFDAQWKITINNLDDSYPVPDSVFVKVLYATEQGAELKDYRVITQQVSGYGTECIKVTAGDVITYSGSYPVWKYQADVGGSYYHKVQILGYMLDGVYIDLTDEGYIFDGEMFYDTETNSASEVMELSYNKTLIPTVGVEGDILVNYSYSYTLPGGAVQEGTQNMTERVRTVRVELLCNGIVVDSADVDLSVVGDIATGSYSFGRWQKYGEHGVNSYSVHAYALDESSETVHDYSVDITRFDAVLTYSPECFDAAWMVVLGGEIPEDLIPSSINVKILYATESGAALEDYEMISQQANNLGVECVLVEDGNGGMTYSGSYPVWKYQADVGGTYYHKIQIVGYTIDGVYYDVSYKALVSEGEMYFDGKNPSCVMEMTLIPEIPAEEITVSGKVLDSNNVGVHGATVELRKGNEVIATTTTDIYGHYSFVDVPDGDYNIVVTYKEGMSDEATEKVLTELVAVDRESGESPNITMEMPDGNVSSVVEIKEEAVEYQKLNPAGALVAGVGEVAKNETPADGQHITIKLEVTPAADLTDSDDEAAAEIKAEQAEIKAQAADKIVEFLDLTLTKTVSENGSNVSSNIEEASALLTIILPFDTERAKAVVVYRYHDGVAAAMTEKPAAGEEGYVVGDGVVIIYAQKFSTYAIGYREADPDSRVYSVTASESENGTVTLDRDYAYVNTLVSFTVTPDDGYELEKLTVIDENGRGVALTDLGNGTYSFRMPNGNVTVSAAFVAVDDTCAKDSTCPAGSFTDTDADEWYHDGVHYCVEEGLMVGMPGDLFDPNGSTTRAQIVTVLWRLEGSPVVDADMTFADVAADEWYTEAIRWAQSVGVVEGYSETVFGPNDTVTREQLAVILYRYEQYKGGGFKGMWMFLLNYPDRADVSDWAYEAMCWMTMHKVIDGVPNGDGVKLDPAGGATRAQVATMLWRFCEETGN